MNSSRWIVLAVLVLLISAFFYFDLNTYLTLENVKQQQAGLSSLLEENPVEFVSAFFLTYVLATALSLPGAAALIRISISILET